MHGLATEHTLYTKLQALVYDILPSRRKVPESDARSVTIYMTVRIMASSPSSVLVHALKRQPADTDTDTDERTSTGVTDLGPHTLALTRSEVD